MRSEGSREVIRVSLPPAPPPSLASASMRSNRQRDTLPELRLRRLLHSKGLRYRVAFPITVDDLKVRADIVFPKRRLAVFVDGCFWHCCPDHGRRPSDPTGYWAAKLDRNRTRDIRVNIALEREGWRVLRIWEHEPVESAQRLIEDALAADPVSRAGRPAATRRQPAPRRRR